MRSTRVRSIALRRAEAARDETACNAAARLIVNEPNHLLRLQKIKRLASVTGVDEESLRMEVNRRTDENSAQIKEERNLIVSRLTSDMKRSPDSVTELMRQAMTKIEEIEQRKEGYDPRQVMSAYEYMFEMQMAHKSDIGIRTGFPLWDRLIGGLPRGAAFLSCPGKPNQGKFQPLTSPVKTPTGWSKMGDLKIGDAVASVDGEHSEVTAIYPQGIQKVYRVTFSDGRSTLAGADHLWKLNFVHEYKEGSGSGIHNGDHIFTTDAIRTFCLNGSHRNAHRTVYVPLVNREFGDEAALPINPWVLGALIGDGGMTSGSVIFTTADHHLVDLMRRHVEPLGLQVVPSGKYSYRISNPVRGWHVPNVLTEKLRKLGLMGLGSHEKHIPKQYLSASKEQRQQLLQGLMDTDGTAGSDTTTLYCTTSRQLALDVQELVRSLGGICPIRTKRSFFKDKDGLRKEGRLAYILAVKMCDRENLFTLPRKIDLAPVRKNLCRLSIVSIELEAEVECQCITVSHPSHLYVTDDYIVTHNTSTCSNLSWRLPEFNEDVITLYHTVDDSLDKAVPRILGSKYQLPSKLFHKAGFYLGHPDGKAEVNEKYPHFPQVYHQAQTWLKDMLQSERLIIADINQLPGSIPALENWLKTIRKRFPHQPMVCMGDNFALYHLDVETDSEAVRARRKSQAVKRMANTYQTCMFMTCELTKESLKPGVRPRMGNIKDTQGVAYDADANLGIYNDLKDRGDSADLVWNYNNQMVPTSVEGTIMLSPRRKPILEMVIDKNKVTDYDGSIFFEFDQVSAELRECDENDQARFRALAETVTSKSLAAQIGGSNASNRGNLVVMPLYATSCKPEESPSSLIRGCAGDPNGLE